MPRAALAYIRWVDGFNRGLGRLVMYGLFILMAILLWSSISKTFFQPSLWTLEAAQFAMVTYYSLGGPYALQAGGSVRMDLFYADWSLKKKAWFDAFTVFLLIFYLGVLFYGAMGSAAYSLGYFGTQPLHFFGDLIYAYVTGGSEAAGKVLGFLERSRSAWRPELWPIKFVMCFGFLLMLLQAFSEFLKDIARIRGEEI